MRPVRLLSANRSDETQMLPFFAKLPSCLVGMEACGTSHHWARELIKLGHEVRLMPPAYVKPYVKRGKTDAADAEAVCEAVRRPTMRFVPVKSPEQQAALSMHRTRDLLVKQRTQLVNMIRILASIFPRVSNGRWWWRDGSSMVKHQTFRLKRRRSSTRCHSRRLTSMFGFARSIAICSPGNVATMLRVVS
jgi:Transposase